MNSEFKKNIIFANKNEFMNFLENDHNGLILQILDNEGIDYLKEYEYTEDRICYILNYSKYVNELFQNNKFLDLFLNTYISRYYASLKNLNKEAYDLILNRCLETNKSPHFIVSLIYYFSNDYQMEYINNCDTLNDIIYILFVRRPDMYAKKILDKFNIDLLSHDININYIVSCGKDLYFKEMANRNNSKGQKIECFYLSSDLLNKDVALNLWNKLNIYEYRALINNAYYCGDPTILNKVLKEQEEKEIFNDSSKPYDDLIECIRTLKTFEIYSSEYHDEANVLEQLLSNIDEEKFYEIKKLIYFKEYDEACKLIEYSFNEKKSDYIIDYHFEENYYNVMYDLRELLDFYYAGNIDLPKDRLYLYEQIVNIDSLSNKEKQELHNKLKEYNMIELFYDDMSFARKIVREAIKDYAMVKDDLDEYLDEELSSKYGVDVYSINDNPFFAIVKSGRRNEENMPVGRSYSLVGNGCISVFGNLENSNTFVYDSSDLNPEQIIHVYPTDSFTTYHPFEFSEKATKRVEQLVLPDEMLYESYGYNELLILEKGRNSTDIDSRIPDLKRIALYCVDKISEKDIETAKNNNVGIMLIDSKNYNKGEPMPKSIYRHIGRNDYYHYNYLINGSSWEIREEHLKNR